MDTNKAQLIVDLSDQELEDLGFLGPDAPELVRSTIKAVQKAKDLFKWLTVFQVQCLQTEAMFNPSPATSPSLVATSQSSDMTTKDPDLASPFEKAFYYKGISEEHPHLFQRSDAQTRPFITTPPEDQHTSIPEKTAHGVFDSILTPDLWKQKVGPAIVELLANKKRNVHLSTMVPVRFSISNEQGKPIFDKHIVIWISVFPGSTTEESCRDANSDILAILENHQVKDGAVHWIEGAAQRFYSPAMMKVVDDTDPTAFIRRAVTAVLSTPISPVEPKEADGQGTLGIFFHEGRGKDGEKSDRVMAFTNKHVVSKDTTRDYQLGHTGARKQWIRNCSLRRFQRLQEETRTFIAKKLGGIAHLSAQLNANEWDSARAKGLKEAELKMLEEDVGMLDDFLNLLNSTWSEPVSRNMGWLEWAPKIQNNLDDRHYTWDGAVFQLEKTKWAKEFKGNHVYLGGKFRPDEIKELFYPNHANPPSFKYPPNHLFPIRNCVDAEGLKKPYFHDEQGNPCFIVAKDGQTSDLTFGRFSGCEAYVANDLEGSSWSWEVAVFNYHTENFSSKGDSGACIFNAEGKMVAFLHSGIPRAMSMSSHITFGTPALSSSRSRSATPMPTSTVLLSSRRQRKLESTILFLFLPSPHCLFSLVSSLSLVIGA